MYLLNKKGRNFLSKKANIFYNFWLLLHFIAPIITLLIGFYILSTILFN